MSRKKSFRSTSLRLTEIGSPVNALLAADAARPARNGAGGGVCCASNIVAGGCDRATTGFARISFRASFWLTEFGVAATGTENEAISVRFALIDNGAMELSEMRQADSGWGARAIAGSIAASASGSALAASEAMTGSSGAGLAGTAAGMDCAFFSTDATGALTGSMI